MHRLMLAPHHIKEAGMSISAVSSYCATCTGAPSYTATQVQEQQYQDRLAGTNSIATQATQQQNQQTIQEKRLATEGPLGTNINIAV